MLSLAVNIWWGIERRGADQPLPAGRPVHAYRNGDTESKAIGSLVASHTAARHNSLRLGFALQDPRVIIFRMGILYTDALAALHSGTLDIATRRIDALGKALESLQAPPLLSHLLTEIHTLLQNRQYTGPGSRSSVRSKRCCMRKNSGRMRSRGASLSASVPGQRIWPWLLHLGAHSALQHRPLWLTSAPDCCS